MPKVELIHGDALDLAARLARRRDVAIVSDPPYGIGYRARRKRGAASIKVAGGLYGRDWQDIRGDDRPFDPSPWISFRKAVLWGANNYAATLPPGGWLVWDKKRGGTASRGFRSSDCEIAWCSEGRTVRLFCYFWDGYRRDGEVGEHYHPAQKPIALMRWCIERLKLPAGTVVVDPYAGSGTTLLAAIELGYPCMGAEIDPAHFATARRRIDAALAAQPLFA